MNKKDIEQLLIDMDIKNNAKKVIRGYLAFADNRDVPVLVSPSDKQVADHLGMSRTTLVKYKDELKNAGWLTDTGKTNVYYGNEIAVWQINIGKITPSLSNQEVHSNLAGINAKRSALAKSKSELLSIIDLMTENMSLETMADYFDEIASIASSKEIKQ